MAIARLDRCVRPSDRSGRRFDDVTRDEREAMTEHTDPHPRERRHRRPPRFSRRGEPTAMMRAWRIGPDALHIQRRIDR